MDIPRPSVRARKRAIRIVASVLGVVLLGMGTYFLARLKPAAPTVSRQQITLGTVKRDDLPIEARAYGSLVAKDLLYMAAACEGRVESIKILPGTKVSKDDVIIVLGNPELELNALNAESKLHESESERGTTVARLRSEYMQQEATVAMEKAKYLQAKLDAERDEELYKEKLVSDAKRQGSRLNADALNEQLEIEKKSLAAQKEGAAAQLAAADAKIAQDRVALSFAKEQIERLQVRAGAEGVLKELLVKTGEQVTAGKSLAVVVNPSQLKAEIKVAETQAKDILPGQVARVDTHNGEVKGRVTRIDPTVTEGTVAVDVEFDEALPAGVRPDLSVTGVIEIERLVNVLQMERPAQATANAGSIGLFRLSPDGKTATRVSAALGKVSVSAVEILGGLNEGDQVILSDMSQWDRENALTLK